MPSSLRNMTNYSFTPSDEASEENVDAKNSRPDSIISTEGNQTSGPKEERDGIHHSSTPNRPGKSREGEESKTLEGATEEIETILSTEVSFESKTEPKNIVKPSDSKAGRRPPPRKPSSKKTHGNETTLVEEGQKKLLEES